MPNGIFCVFLVCLFTVFDHDWLKMTYVRRPVAENSETRASNSHPIVSWLEWNRREGKTFARSNEKNQRCETGRICTIMVLYPTAFIFQGETQWQPQPLPKSGLQQRLQLR